MTQRKTFSLSEGDMVKLEPILQKHNGNFSAALRELIALGHDMISQFGSIETALQEMQPKKTFAQEMIENRYGILLPYSFVQWGLRLLEGFSPPKGTLITPIEDSVAQSKEVSLSITKDNYKQWEDIFNEIYPQLGWEVKITIESINSTFIISFNGLDPEINRLAQEVISLRLASHDPPFKIEELREYLPLVTIYYKKCSSTEEALERFTHVFHYQEDLYDMIKNRRPFLSRLATLLKEFNYEVTVLPSEYMEELLSGHFSLFLLKLIQRQAGKSVSELTAGELLEALDEVNQSAHLYKKMEKKDYRIVFFHSYDNPESIRKLGNILSEILRQAYLSLSMEIAENMLVFRIYPTQTENPRILIVDEKLESLLSLKYELEQEFDVLDAQEGTDVLKKVQENPAIILLDASLPPINGISICSRLKQDENTAHIPIILMIPEGQSPADKLVQQADDCIMKPFELKDLRAKMELLFTKMPPRPGTMIAENPSD
jgi:CheY-like chemotaxis protein